MIERRNLLRGSGVAFALPFLPSLIRPNTAGAANRDERPPQRFVAICNNLGLHAPNFIPSGKGSDWTPSKYLRVLDEFRHSMTVLTGVSHPEVDGGHNAEKSFLTAAPHPASGSFKNSISLDQLAATHLGGATRFPSLALSVNTPKSLAWTRAGVPIPSEQRPSRVFRRLFVDGNADEKKERIESLRQGQSVMDVIMDQANRLDKRLNPADRHKFDEYVTSVREVERGLVRQQEWAKTPKPEVNPPPPRDIDGQADIIGKSSLMFDLIHLAVASDSTRFITLLCAGHFIVPPIDGVQEGYHTLSHHGKNPKKLEQLALIETEEMRILRDLIAKLRDSKEAGGSLLDNTMVLYGSNLGNASSHDNSNLPTMLIGGQFRHGQHLAFDANDNQPLANLYVSLLQRLGIETDRFGISGTKTIPGLELA